MAFTPRGIKYPTPSDRIKDNASLSRLADDLRDVAQTADAAVSTAEWSAKTYADSGDAKTLGLASTDAAAKANSARHDAIQAAEAKAGAAERNAKIYTDTVVNTSHISIDSDGVPYIRVGSMTARVLLDTDGTPYFEPR